MGGSWDAPLSSSHHQGYILIGESQLRTCGSWWILGHPGFRVVKHVAESVLLLSYRNTGSDIKSRAILLVTKKLGGGFKHFLFSPLLGEDSHFD